MAAVRLQNIRQQFAGHVRLEWRSFPLAPEEKGERRVYPAAAAGWRSMADQEPGADFAPWTLSHYVSSSIPALEAARCAGLQGEEPLHRFHSLTMRGFFAESRDISDREVLVELAREAELDVERFVADFDSHTQQPEVLREYREATERYGITGIPTTVIDDRWILVGAQPAEVFRRLVEARMRGEDLG